MPYSIPNKIDFYITNVCNYTCNRCNRFNNHDFKGWQRWSDYKDIYEDWGRLIDLPCITIMGGEPLLNPTVVDWVNGLSRIFQIDVQVLTNGTRFNYVDGLYESMLHRSKKNNAQNHIGVSLHNHDDWPQMREDIYKFLKGPVKELAKDENPWKSDYGFIDKNNVKINVWESNNFGAAAVIQQPNGRFTLHNSDPVSAHQNCAFVKWKSYHMIRGRLYKCGPVALMPDFDQQFNLDISDEDRIILNSYKSLGLDNFTEYNKEFFDNLANPIAQCKFCATSYSPEKIFPIRKGRIPN